MSIEVVKPGLLTTLQDVGRPGYAHLGIGRSGAFDAPALAIANALCGNARGACGLEITLLGPSLRFRIGTRIAVTGAPLPLTIDGIAMPMWTPLPVPAGATVALGAMRTGCRSYLAVCGGVAVAAVLGSRSMDVNGGLGPLHGRPLAAGDILPLVPLPPARAVAATAPKWRLDPRPWFGADGALPVRLLPGPHFDSLQTHSRKQLFSEPFTVDNASNRAGVRLRGPALEWTTRIEMISEGCVPGLLQLPPSGQPIAFGPEGPVSGGYPRLGQVAAADLARLAQARPGDALRFTPCTLEEALGALRERERALSRLATVIAARLAA